MLEQQRCQGDRGDNEQIQTDLDALKTAAARLDSATAEKKRRASDLINPSDIIDFIPCATREDIFKLNMVLLEHPDHEDIIVRILTLLYHTPSKEGTRYIGLLNIKDKPLT